MAIHTLFRRWRTGALTQVEAESLSLAIERIVAARVSLAHVDLKGLDAPGCLLQGADLRGADFEAANLPGAFLGRADLRSASLVAVDLKGATLLRADLRRADLRHADLRRADLREADFTGADLRDVRAVGARLDGARLDWRWPAFVLELLRRNAGLHPDAHRLVADIAFDHDERPYAWMSKIIRHPNLIGWATSVIRRAIRPGDNAPEVLRRLAADGVEAVGDRVDGTPDAAPAGFYWTRAVHPRDASRRTPF